MDAGSIITAFADVAETVGGLIQTGFATEYDPKRRIKLAADVIPTYYNGIRGLFDAARAAGAAGKPALADKIRRSRPMLQPAPFPPYVIPSNPQADDSLSIELYGRMLTQKADMRRAGAKRLPITGDGGNVAEARPILQMLFNEALIFSTLPEAVALQGGLSGTKASAEAAVDFIFGKPDGLRIVFGSSEDTDRKRLPRQLRDRILQKFIEHRNLGLYTDEQPLPPWLFGFAVDGSDNNPPVYPTIGAYLAYANALGQGLLTPEAIDRLGVIDAVG